MEGLLDKCLLYLEVCLRSVLTAIRTTLERAVWECNLDDSVDWLRVFMVTCMSHSTDLSTITCVWSLVKARGLNEYLNTVEDKYVCGVEPRRTCNDYEPWLCQLFRELQNVSCTLYSSNPQGEMRPPYIFIGL